MQWTVKGKENLSNHSVLPSSGYDKLHATDDTEEGLYLNATKDQENKVGKEEESVYPTAGEDQEGTEGGAEVLCLAGALTQVRSLGVTRDQELFSLPLGETDMDMCTVYTNKQVEYLCVCGRSIHAVYMCTYLYSQQMKLILHGVCATEHIASCHPNCLRSLCSNSCLFPLSLHIHLYYTFLMLPCSVLHVYAHSITSFAAFSSQANNAT